MLSTIRFSIETSTASTPARPREGRTPLSTINLLILARCHVAFERDDDAFDIWPEVGSRAMQRVLMAGTDAFVEGWLAVQEGNYCFRTSQANGLTVNIVLREYLGC